MPKKQRNYNKGLVTLRITVTAQTAYHLNRWAALTGLTIGKVIDKIVRSLTAAFQPKDVPHHD